MKLGAGGAALLLLCCTAPAPARVLSLLEMRQDKVVPQHWDISCGAAALATVLTYEFGDAVSERMVAAAMLGGTDPAKVKKRGGFSLLDLKHFAESRGYKATGYGDMALDDLLKSVPAIVPLHAVSANHFVVFRGMVGGARVALSDPAWGNRTMPVAQFEAAWEKVGFVVERTDGGDPPNALTVRPDDRLLPRD